MSNNFVHCHVHTTDFLSSKVKFIHTSTVTGSHSCYGKIYAYASRTFCFKYYLRYLYVSSWLFSDFFLIIDYDTIPKGSNKDLPMSKNYCIALCSFYIHFEQDLFIYFIYIQYLYSALFIN